jgi:hypothetical protein
VVNCVAHLQIFMKTGRSISEALLISRKIFPFLFISFLALVFILTVLKTATGFSLNGNALKQVIIFDVIKKVIINRTGSSN